MFTLSVSEHSEAQKKGVYGKVCACGNTMGYRGFLPRTFVSSLGDITVCRRYYASRVCDCKIVAWDDWSGITP
jgi:hypothetical protein